LENGAFSVRLQTTCLACL